MIRKIIRISVICFAIVFCRQEAFSQSALFNHITIDNGLSYNSVSCLAQDQKGFIWIGTYNGLNKYDGYKITTYLNADNDTTKLLSANIRCLYPDDDNNLWVGTLEGGLSKIDLQTNKIRHYLADSVSHKGILDNTINDIKEFEDGYLYIATNYGLSILNKKTNEFRSVLHSDKNPNSLLADHIKTMSKDQQGNIWYGHSGYGITKFNPKQKTYTRYTATTEQSELRGNKIRCVFTDSKGLVWISMWHAGLTVYNPQTNKFWNNKDSSQLFSSIAKIGLVSQIIEDKNSDIWMCTAEKGIVKYERKTGITTYFENNPNDPESISDNTNLCIMQDLNGLIWSGTWKGGLNYFNPNCLNFGHIKHESNKQNTLNDNLVLSFYQNVKDEVIIGTGKSICYFHPTTKQFSDLKINETEPNSLHQNSQVTCTLKDSDGTYCYTTNGGGLYHYDPKTKKYKNYNVTADPNSLSNSIPNIILLDKENNLWISTFGSGINLYNRQKDNFTRFLNDPSNSDLYGGVVTAMNLDKSGKIWIGTEKNGLLLLDPRTKEITRPLSHKKEAQLNTGIILTMAFDKNEKLWVSCGNHLLEFDIRSYQIIDHSENNSLLNSDFIAIVHDDRGQIWLSSSNGLYRYDPVTKNTKLYSRSDGIQSKEFNYRSALKLSNGKILIGGTNGLNYFDPNEIKETSTAPTLALTELLVLNKPFEMTSDISRTKEITLSYKDYLFSFHFAAFDFSDPKQNKFMYKLDGLDDDWIEIGTQHQITFTNLDPGTYVLNIKGSNSQGVWNEEPLKLSITITPPFWRTKWFYAMCLIVVVSAIYFYIQYREKKLILEKEILEQKVDERTKELHEEKLKVEEAHKDIKDSINYAQKIQSAIIPSEEDFKQVLPNSFVLFQPKDIVSGDFYWLVEKKDHVFFAIADCTGHGVPGGFMTMLGSGLLNEIVNEQQVTEPAEILNKLREKIISSLKQTGKSGENKDGMDIVLLRFNKTDRELCYATANNGFILVDNNEMSEYYGDKQPVGIYGHEIKPFTQNRFTISYNATIYSYTDGYPDQFGGPKGKKFKYKALNETLVANTLLSMEDQKSRLKDTLKNWMGDLEQIDDVCIVGIRF